MRGGRSGINRQFGTERRLIGIIDPREILQLTGAGLLVEAFGITLLARRDGSYVLLAWVEAPAWDNTSLTPIAVAPQSATIQFARAPSGVSVGTFDDAGTLTTAAGTVSSNGALTLKVDDRVTIVDVRP